jgi:hypothetical protein
MQYSMLRFGCKQALDGKSGKFTVFDIFSYVGIACPLPCALSDDDFKRCPLVGAMRQYNRFFWLQQRKKQCHSGLAVFLRLLHVHAVVVMPCMALPVCITTAAITACVHG